MDFNIVKTGLWQQFGAAIDMLSDALDLCPDQHWTTALWKDAEDPRYGQFWYIAYHCLSWTDLFLGGSYAEFKPPAPFIRGKLPEQPYTKEQVRGYLEQVRAKCQSTLAALTEERAVEICKFEWMEPTYLELQFYSMRHVQEHGAHLNMVLGQHDIEGQDWVATAREKTT